MRNDSIQFEQEYREEHTYYSEKIDRIISRKIDDSTYVLVTMRYYNWLGKIKFIINYDNQKLIIPSCVRRRYSLWGVHKVFINSENREIPFTAFCYSIIGKKKRFYTYMYGREKMLTTRTKYDIRGNVRQIDYIDNGDENAYKGKSLSSQDIWKYDDEFRIQRVVSKDFHQNSVKEWNYNYYDIDAYGNYAKKIVKTSSGEVFVTTRTIKYYED